MSADNGYVIRKNSSGRYALQMYFASNDEYPPVTEEDDTTFETLEEAVLKYEDLENNSGYLC